MRINYLYEIWILLKIIILKKIPGLRIFKNKSGNLSIISGVTALIFFMLFISVFDIFQLYIAREHTKNASDAIALAIAQNLLFFEENKIFEIAKKAGEENYCEIDSIEFNYEEIIVTTVKKVNFLFWDKIFKNNSLVYSTSKVKVTYPWDEKFGNCRFFIFDY
ncbi:hypothetical protein LLG07_02255 [bacterium]|nr:hypothetical protein [bacterium]